MLLLQPDKLFSNKDPPAKTRPLRRSAAGILTRGPCSLPRVVLTAVAGRCANAGSTRNRSSSHEVQPDLVIPPSSYDSRTLSLPPGLLHAQLQQRRGRAFANLCLPSGEPTDRLNLCRFSEQGSLGAFFILVYLWVFICRLPFCLHTLLLYCSSWPVQPRKRYKRLASRLVSQYRL